MNANDSLERGIADVYEREAPPRAPEWVLSSVLDAVETTPQRRVLIPAPWRFRHMNTYAKVAIAAVVVVAIGAVGLTMFGPRNAGVGGQPTASPTISPSPSPTFGATVIPKPAPALTETFTSERHGFSISYPSGWTPRPATDPWTTGFPDYSSSAGDIIYDPAQADHLWIMVASQPLGAKTGTQWVDDLLAQQGNDCGAPIEPVTIAGGEGKVCGTAIAAFSSGDRGYVMNLYTSGDDPSAVAAYDQEFFRNVAATLQLRPADAVDTPTSPSASPSG